MRLVIVVLLFLIVACSKQVRQEEQSFEEENELIETIDLWQMARELSRDVIIVDGHIDLPYRLRSKPEDVSVRTNYGHFDYVRAKEGGLDAPFMSIYIPASYEMNGALSLARQIIQSVDKLCQSHPDKFAMAYSPDDVYRNFQKGLISLPLGLENGAPVEGNLSNLDILFQLGIRYITLTHSKDNHICDSSYDQQYTHGGLSAFGEEVIRRMNELGIMIDVSHVSDSAFYQIFRLSNKPVIASHSSCRHFTPGFERNMSDDMIRKVGEKNGIVMVNFGSYFLTSRGYRELNKLYKSITAGADGNDPAVATQLDSLRSLPDLMGDISIVADHIDRIIQIAGIDHIGLGSDFDGVDHLPVGLEDVSKYPDLIHELLVRGYTRDEIEKICYRNIFRVWNEVLNDL